MPTRAIRQYLVLPAIKVLQYVRQRLVLPVYTRLQQAYRFLALRVSAFLRSFWQYFRPPVIEGSYEKTRIAELVNTVLITFIINAGVFMILSPFVYPEPFPFIMIFMIMVLLRHGAIAIMRKGWVLIAALILAVVLWLVATFLVFISGGINGPHVLTYITVVLVAGLLIGGRSGILFALLSVLLTLWLTLSWQDKLPKTPLEIQTPLSTWVILTANLVIVALFQYMAWNSLKRSLTRANQLAQEATEANAYKTRLLARVSHELRSPLGSILGFTEMLHSEVLGALTTEQKDAAHRLLNNTRYLQRLVIDLLDQSRIEAGQIVIQEIEFSPAELVRRVHSLLLDTAQDKELALKVDIDSNLPATLLGDPGRIEQVLFNLANNAIKFTDKGHIDLKAYLPNHNAAQEWILQISDTGVGIPPDAQARIFEPFYQLDESLARKYGGVGLGLAIVQQLVNLLKGRITLESEVGHGSTFTVFLPLSRKS